MMSICVTTTLMTELYLIICYYHYCNIPYVMSQKWPTYMYVICHNCIMRQVVNKLF